jgi:hypothetical protein
MQRFKLQSFFGLHLEICRQKKETIKFNGALMCLV